MNSVQITVITTIAMPMLKATFITRSARAVLVSRKATTSSPIAPPMNATQSCETSPAALIHHSLPLRAPMLPNSPERPTVKIQLPSIPANSRFQTTKLKLAAKPTAGCRARPLKT